MLQKARRGSAAPTAAATLLCQEQRLALRAAMQLSHCDRSHSYITAQLV